MNAQNAQWLILVLVNIPVFLGLGRIIFSDWNSFFEALRLWTSADWWFTLQKQWQLDRWDTAKLPVFVLGCVALVLLEQSKRRQDELDQLAAQTPEDLHPAP